jgi:hypothetical protein
LARFLATERRRFDEALWHPAVRKRGAGIEFEQLVTHRDRVVAEAVLPALGLPPQPAPEPTRKRQRHYELHEVVRNYDEVRDRSAGRCRAGRGRRRVTVIDRRPSDVRQLAAGFVAPT